jgi:inner membrane protein
MGILGMNIWIFLGVLLLIVEVLTTSFYAIFFGIGALITGILVYLGVVDDKAAQIGIFALSSMMSLYFFRRKLSEIFRKPENAFKEIVDEYAKVSIEILPGEEGKVFYRGADWIAYSAEGKAIEKNKKVLIKKIDGIKLIVEEL